MLNKIEFSGVAVFLVGVIAVVMAGVGLSMMVDQRFSFSRTAVSIEREINASSLELDRLRTLLEENRAEYARLDLERGEAVGAYEMVKGKLDSLRLRREDLIAAAGELKKTTTALDASFSEYSRTYRERIRAAAVGESLKNLRIRGRDFHEAVIVRVTDVGLEIRHRDGRARVRAADMNPAMRERFQWTEEERLAEPEKDGKTNTRIVEPAEPEVNVDREKIAGRTTRTDAGPESQRLESLRANVIAWKVRVGRLTADRDEAVSAARRGAQSSVPGSLETWRDRAARLNLELSRAKSNLAAAKASLTGIFPQDPLLRPDERRP